MSPAFPIILATALVAAGAYWSWSVDRTPPLHQLLRLETICAFLLSAIVILSPLWNATAATAVHSGYRASTMFTIIPALALPAITYPGAAVYALQVNEAETTLGFVRFFSWLLLVLSAVLVITL